MPERRKRFRAGTSYIEYEGQTWEEPVKEAIITETDIKMDIISLDDDGKPDLEFVSAESTDNGQTYTGCYRYQRGSYKPGGAEFKRVRRADGSDEFQGYCTDEEGTKYEWKIVIDPL